MTLIRDLDRINDIVNVLSLHVSKPNESLHRQIYELIEKYICVTVPKSSSYLTSIIGVADEQEDTYDRQVLTSQLADLSTKLKSDEDVIDNFRRLNRVFDEQHGHSPDKDIMSCHMYIAMINHLISHRVTVLQDETILNRVYGYRVTDEDDSLPSSVVDVDRSVSTNPQSLSDVTQASTLNIRQTTTEPVANTRHLMTNRNRTRNIQGLNPVGSMTSQGELIVGRGQSSTNRGQSSVSQGLSTTNRGQSSDSQGRLMVGQGQSSTNREQSSTSRGQSTDIQGRLMVSRVQSSTGRGQSKLESQKRTILEPRQYFVPVRELVSTNLSTILEVYMVDELERTTTPDDSHIVIAKVSTDGGMSRELEVYDALRSMNADIPQILTGYQFMGSPTLIMERLSPLKVSIKRLSSICRSMIQQLRVVHVLGVHCDVKPSNIMQSLDGTKYYLVDYGGMVLWSDENRLRMTYTPSFACQRPTSKEPSTFSDLIELVYTLNYLRHSCNPNVDASKIYHYDFNETYSSMLHVITSGKSTNSPSVYDDLLKLL